ncbi:universal stress protein A-like protein [Panicum virgatum]|uniref:universal stress protein A-like protein n=1 Tax=Panicum virgatum TaxID=38727 RepID=UPI0019D4F2A4|nr:universal stress protein A-like protein [Panicum virgatum]
MAGRNIGVAVDFSSCSKAALRWASTNLTRSALIPLAEFSDVTKTYSVSPDKETIEILTQVANQRGIEVFAKILYGDPAKKLYEAVDLVPLSCMVIGSRGLSTLKRALMGSVSTYIVNHAACPVTVVKENM